MKDDFAKAVEKADLYAELAMVVTLSFSDVKVTNKTMDKNSPVPAVAEKHYKPAELCTAFLKYLTDENIPHEVLLVNKDNLTFVLAREEEPGEKNARAVVDGFFRKNGGRIALSSEAYYQAFDSHTKIKNKLLSPVSPLRREVTRKAARINGK